YSHPGQTFALVAVAGPVHGHRFLLESLLQELRQPLLIFDDQDFHLDGISMFLSGFLRESILLPIPGQL
ncbi:MAG: hypothetical protein V3T95_01300, partial [Acidobacteriota bacterium]